jgi:hypothetical protein
VARAYRELGVLSSGHLTEVASHDLATTNVQLTVLGHQAGEQREPADACPGDFLTVLGILMGKRLFTTGVVTEPGSVLVVPVQRVRAVIAHGQAPRRSDCADRLPPPPVARPGA